MNNQYLPIMKMNDEELDQVIFSVIMRLKELHPEEEAAFGMFPRADREARRKVLEKVVEMMMNESAAACAKALP